MSGETMDIYIWQDFCQTAHTIKVYAGCCTKYANKMRKQKRIFEWLIILITAIGASLFPLSEYFTLGAAILTSLGGVIEKIAPIATQPESELCEIDTLQTKFNILLTDFESRFHDFRMDPNVTDIKIKEFLKSKKTALSEMTTKLDKLVRKSPDSDNLNDIAYEYIKEKFSINSTSNG
jgi:hypothetical protein